MWAGHRTSMPNSLFCYSLFFVLGLSVSAGAGMRILIDLDVQTSAQQALRLLQNEQIINKFLQKPDAVPSERCCTLYI